ncbi:MAG: hypothetical protein LH629_04375, partial [Ignavibacteria bacterium]|nr:hypothetical protein [Ignavibacteria bacterium]
PKYFLELGIISGLNKVSYSDYSKCFESRVIDKLGKEHPFSPPNNRETCSQTFFPTAFQMFQTYSLQSMLRRPHASWKKILKILLYSLTIPTKHSKVLRNTFNITLHKFQTYNAKRIIK